MRKAIILGAAALLLLSPDADAKKGRPMIFDTDWWTDVDDACAVRILLKADKARTIDLKGICLSAVDGESYESLGKFLAYEGRTDIPVGADKEGTDFGGVPKWRGPIISSVKTPVLTDAQVEDCVDFYRRILAKSRKRVDIVAVGFPNTLSKLLESGPDKWSKLSGKELVAKKAGHLWLMAGKFPEGKEHNFCNNKRSRKAGDLVCREWPGEITFLGFEIGIEVIAGKTLADDDLLKKVLVAHGSGAGRYAWDPLTLWMAVKGSPEAAGFGSVRGTCSLNPKTGVNNFTPSPDGAHRYVTFIHEPDWYAAHIDEIIGTR